MMEIRKYRRTRHGAVYVDVELLAGVVYRIGAEAVADMLRKTRFSKEAEHAAQAAVFLFHGSLDHPVSVLDI